MKNKIKEPIFYKIIRPLVKIYTNTFIRPKYKGLNNIPLKGKIILAGTHTSKLDPLLIISSTKRVVHFFAKKELWEFPKSIIFNHLGLIKVDRQNHTTDPLGEGKKYLDDNKAVLIFPEGTIEKEKGKSLPYKVGVVKLAYETNTEIVPFAIRNNNKEIIYGKPYKVITDDYDKELEILKQHVEELRNE